MDVEPGDLVVDRVLDARWSRRTVATERVSEVALTGRSFFTNSTGVSVGGQKQLRSIEKR